MTKKLLILFAAILFIIPFNSKASHYMGGEISWECMPNGNYRFILKRYRECNGVYYSNSTTLNVTNHPTLTSINMNLVSQTDISPTCNQSLPNIACYPNPGINNSGAIEEWIWTSDSIYPNGVTISGVPPASGWIFANTSCCRNPSTNLQGASSWYLRAIMHNYNGRPAGVCDDNSPDFLTVPTTVLCTGYPFTYYIGAQDEEFDSLSYDFVPSLSYGINIFHPYETGYSYTSPLPSTTQNPANIPASINHNTGELCFTSFNSGAYVVAISVKAYKQQQLAAEIVREFQIVILDCSQNNAPTFITPTINNATIPSFSDTVVAGDLVSFNITGVDLDSILTPSGLVPQTVSIKSYGTQYDTNYTSNGCDNPPCATLYPPPYPNPISAPVSATTYFQWQTSLNHISSNISQTYHRYKNVYNFVFDIQDDFCPVPKSVLKNITIYLVPRDLIPQPQPRTTEVLTNGDVKISWERSDTSNNNFDSYIIYHSNRKEGPFIALDTLNSPWVSNFEYTHIGANTKNSSQHFYYLRTISIIEDDFNLLRYMNEAPSDTISTMKLEVYADPNNFTDIKLEWTPISKPLPPSCHNMYYIYRNIIGNQPVLLDSTTNCYYTDFLLSFQNYEYFITIKDSSGYTSISPIVQHVYSDMGINENKTDFNINIFPNPAQNTINFEQYLDEDIKMEIYDANGRLVKTIDKLDKGITTINISSLAKGIYSIKFASENNTSFKKIVIE